MMREPTLNAWDGVYLDLVALQRRAMRVLGYSRGAEMYRLLGELRQEAERVAPPGWLVADLGLTEEGHDTA